MSTTTSLPAQRILSHEEVLARVPVSRTTLWRMERKGLFPKRFHLTVHRVGWLETDIDTWMEEKGLANRRSA